ncbi:MAG: 30S ribosomal protein S4 [Candidatus Omnitrophica bacterium]|nr:30S ribosomal protein S4 [Candidatus Omnitrophota bacterium]
MAKYKGPACRLCRREGIKLFLKGERCMSDKCSISRRPYIPGQHGKTKPKLSEYALQLREKQKVKRMYGILERQFKSYFRKASRAKGVTGEILLQFLERRLDSVIYNLGFAVARPQARQIVKHGHVRVNGHKVDIPSYMVKPNDVINLVGKESFVNSIKQNLEISKERAIPQWLELSADKLEAKVLRLPLRSDIVLPVKEALIVELYSK